MLPRGLVTALTILISIAWAANVVVGFLSPDRHDPTLNAIFAIVVGAVYALGRKDSRLSEARRRIAEVIAGDDKTPPDEPDRRDE